MEQVVQGYTGSTHDGGMIPVDVGSNSIGLRMVFKSPGTIEQVVLRGAVTAGSR